MLVEDAASFRTYVPDIAVVAENIDCELTASSLAAAFRRSGFWAELVATGSPRKRFDRARRLDPALIVSLDVREGVHTRSIKLLDERYNRSPAAHAVFESFFSSP